MKKRNNLVALIAVAAGSLGSSAALALGGLDSANSIAEDIKTGLYLLVGTLAVIYLIYLAAMAFTEKKTWSDFGWGLVHISVAGAAVALATWAWNLFK
jgi:hypothetical protein